MRAVLTYKLLFCCLGKWLLSGTIVVFCTVFQVHFRLGKLINSASKEGAPNTLQKELEPSTEQVDEDIIQQINPASTKNEKKDGE